MDELEMVGTELAERVAERLSKGMVLKYSHRDYCGTGLYAIDGAFIHIQVGDWGPPTLEEALSLQAAGKQECRVFLTRAAFVDWLSRQSDESLSGKDVEPAWLRGNQRITVYQLNQFVASSEADRG